MTDAVGAGILAMDTARPKELEEPNSALTESEAVLALEELNFKELEEPNSAMAESGVVLGLEELSSGMALALEELSIGIAYKVVSPSTRTSVIATTLTSSFKT